MNKKKKMTLFAIVMIVIMSLTGCGGKFTCVFPVPSRLGIWNLPDK